LVLTMTEFQCYNKGCGAKFLELENTAESCRHHPGEPVFHDAYKGWSCCNKKTTDFTDFLNITGCSLGKHNPEKPAELPKPRQEVEVPEVKDEPRKPVVAMERPLPSLPMKRLPQTVAASLLAMLEKMNAQGDTKQAKVLEVGVVPIGTVCKNPGCKGTFQGEQSSEETCLFHNGAPIFHEGMKYWSCCQRKTSDFSAFLEQEGCSTGKHIWFKQKTSETNVNCRYDWHQTGSQVVISVFAKGADPDRSFVNVNPVKCKIHIVFGEDKAVFSTTLILGGIVDITASAVEYLGSKVEIKMKKAEAVSWKNLFDDSVPPSKALEEDLENVNLDDVKVLVNDSQQMTDLKKRVLFGESD